MAPKKNPPPAPEPVLDADGNEVAPAGKAPRTKPSVDVATADQPYVVRTMQDRLDAILKTPGVKTVAKDTGTNIVLASTLPSVVPRTRTHIVKFDLMLRGGVPRGVVHHWWGPKSTGKTTTALIAIGAAQKECSRCGKRFSETPACCATPRRTVCAYLNSESFMDWVWAQSLGVDRSCLIYKETTTAEELADLYEALLTSGEVDWIVVDTLAYMTPESELGKSAKEFDVGTQARLLHRMMRKTVSTLADTGSRGGVRPTVILLNQIRMKVGVMFGNPETTAGGLGPGYAAGVELRFGAAETKKDSSDPTGGPLSVTLKPKVEKCKLFPGKGAECEFTLLQRDTEWGKVGEQHDAPQLVELGVQAGLVEGITPKILCLGEDFRGKSLIELRIQQDKVFAAKLRDAVFQVLLKV